ncbi:AbrB/MazE/SpoVT family DNA-binding domain-containing protein [Endozoicomonas sp. 4G]|uniref:AbrB/MazE/SpoVT family DNA-binding domain-containing protein n=1 Tax=Endozoicomonas sp. 4G TaxID=2872754 RepID=UPI002078B706|nr:AbrB/MazE/SpoVT family DNA-binding domain-containing protein [Endozoicomonas sp. 4G]
MNTVIRRIGNSSGIIIPPKLLRKLNLKDGDGIVITKVKNSLVITKSTNRPRYSMDELLAQCDLSVAMPKEFTEWDSVPAVGDEVL